MFLKNTFSLSSLGWNFCSEGLFTECWENMERNLIIVVETQCHLSSRSNVIVVRSNKAASRVAPGHNGGHQTSRNWNSSSPFVTRNLSSLGQALKITILWACKRPDYFLKAWLRMPCHPVSQSLIPMALRFHVQSCTIWCNSSFNTAPFNITK